MANGFRIENVTPGKGFFVVFNPSGSKPTVAYDFQIEADNEARRLAKSNPGERFFVLQAVTSVEKPPEVIVTELAAEIVIPF